MRYVQQARAATCAFIAVFGATALVGGSVETDRPRLPTAAQSATGGVALDIRLAHEDFVEGDNPTFTLSLRNTSATSVLLNGGSMLGNGEQSWSAIECMFRSRAGQSVPLSLHWGVSHVGGRLYFLGVPLRPAAVYSIPVATHDYIVKAGRPLPAGSYMLQCSYSGSQSQLRDTTQMPGCWEGRATSPPVRVVVRPAGPVADRPRARSHRGLADLRLRRSAAENGAAEARLSARPVQSRSR